MTAFTSKGRPHFFRTVTSAEVGKTDTVEIDLSNDGDFTSLTHIFLGVQMFDSGGAQIEDSAGTFTIDIQTDNTKIYEPPPAPTIDATEPTTISWAGNTLKIRVVPLSLSATVTYRVVATANRS